MGVERIVEGRDELLELFRHAGVERVVYVDDENVPGSVPVTEVIGAIEATAGDRRTTNWAAKFDLNLKRPRSAWVKELEERWATLDVAAQRAEARTLGVELDEHTGFGNTLHSLLGDHVELRILGPVEWERKRDALVPPVPDEGATDVPAPTPRTLFLFDLNMSTIDNYNETSGLTFAQGIIQGPGRENVLCGIVSGGFRIGDEQNEAIAALGPDRQDRIVFLAKGRLSVEPASFASGLKRAVLAPDVTRLREFAREAIASAHAEATAAIDNLDLVDLVYGVMRASHEEGVWEMDTLRRVYDAHFKTAVRKAERTDDTVPALARRMRESMQVAKKIIPNADRPSWDFTVQERYETGEDLAAFNMPLELGDVFECTVDGAHREYMLLVQPCDVMVRGDLPRKAHTGLLVPIKSDEPNANQLDAAAELPFHPTRPAGKRAWAWFREAIPMPLFMLDLTVYGADGRSEWTVGQERPDVLHAASERQFERIEQQASELIARVRKPPVTVAAAEPAAPAQPAVAPAGTPTVAGEELVATTDGTETPTPPVGAAGAESELAADPLSSPFLMGMVTDTSVRYECRRVSRLVHPYSAAVLTKFAHYLSRAAFETPLGVAAA